ncbi:MAG: ABC transporter permease [Vicinamibacterales bacterium]
MSRRVDAWLRLVAWMVPGDVRREWLREWRAEFAWRQARAVRTGRTPGGQDVWYAAGALPHALWLRWDRWRFDMLWQDVKHAWRALRRRPGFTALTLVTLALGIGATATIFGAVYAVLLRPLPFPDADRLVQVMETSTRNPRGMAVSPPNFVDWRRDSRSIRGMAAIASSNYALGGDGRAAEQVSGAQVTGDFFDVLATGAQWGRVLAPEDAAGQGLDVVVLSHALWARRFGSDPATIGRRIVIDGTPREVVGVMPRGFRYPLESDIWLPLPFSEEELTTQRGAHYLDVIGRLAPEVAVEQARADLRAIGDRLAAEYPRWNADESADVEPLRDVLVGDARDSLMVLLGAVGLVLLIVCVNVAGLVLVRAAGRSRELAVRRAIGAGRGALVRSLLVESLILGAGGGILGVLLASWALAAAPTLAAVDVPLLDQTRLDGTVLLFTVGVSLAATVLFGTAPAWFATAGLDMSASMREEGGSTTADPRRQWWRGAVIVIETSLAVVLLVAAGLLARSFARLTQVDLGFATSDIQTFTITMPDGTYGQPAQRAALVDELLARIAGRPDVAHASAIFGMPLTDFSYGISTTALDGVRLADARQDELSVQVRVVTPDYFETMGIPLVRGRSLTAADRLGRPEVAILSEAAARRYFPGEDPLGHHVELGTRLGQGGAPVGGQIVGVVADVRDRGRASPPRPTLYVAHAQFPVGFVTVAIRSDGRPAAVVEPARQVLEALDRDVPMFRVRTMAQLASHAVAQPRASLVVIGVFATSALVLSALGLYGVLAFAVGQRTREIGIRRALGAADGSVVRIVTRHAAGLTAIGIAVGLGAALAISRVLRPQLHDVAPTDVVTYAGVALLVSMVSMVATLVPAWRAARIDPLMALRHD